MGKAVEARKPLRARTTKLCTAIQAEIATGVPWKETLADLIVRLKEVREELIVKNAAVLDAMLDAKKTEQEMEDEDDECQEYMSKIRNAIKLADHLITGQTSVASNSSTSATCSTTKDEKSSFKLPRIDYPKFDGDLKNWLGWWSQFQKIDQNPKLHNSDKFQYLILATAENSEPREIISVYPPTGDNYTAAIESLRRRYGREGLQLQVYLRELLNMVIANVTKNDKIPLDKLYLKLESHLRALDTLDLSKAEPSMYFYPLVESSLPEEVLRTWLRNSSIENHGDVKKNKLEDLMDFIKREVEGEQQIYLAQNAFQDHSKGQQNQRSGTSKSKKNDIPTSQSLFSGSESRACIFCNKSNHNSQECYKAQKMTLEEKTEKIKKGRGCFKCFQRTHISKSCKSTVKCIICGDNHFAIMCRGKEKSKVTSDTENDDVKSERGTTALASTSMKKEGLVLMKTVRVSLVNSHGRKYSVRLLFDEGSNRSYVKTATAEKLKCKVIEEFKLETTLFGGSTTVPKPKKKYLVRLQSLDDNFKGEFQFINEDIICGQCPRIPYGPWMEQLRKQKIFMNDTIMDDPEIEILIGSNLWPRMMTGRMFKVSDDLIAVESVFGWTLSGQVSVGGPEKNYAGTIITMLTHAEKSLPEMWELEAIGIRDSSEKLARDEHDQKIKEEFKKKIEREPDGRYIVELPWINENIPLPNNKIACEKRLLSTTRKLMQEDLFITYDKIFRSWEEEQLIERIVVASKDGHYLPHHLPQF